MHQQCPRQTRTGDALTRASPGGASHLALSKSGLAKCGEGAIGNSACCVGPSLVLSLYQPIDTSMSLHQHPPDWISSPLNLQSQLSHPTTTLPNPTNLRQPSFPAPNRVRGTASRRGHLTTALTYKSRSTRPFLNSNDSTPEISRHPRPAQSWLGQTPPPFWTSPNGPPPKSSSSAAVSSCTKSKTCKSSISMGFLTFFSLHQRFAPS